MDERASEVTRKGEAGGTSTGQEQQSCSPSQTQLDLDLVSQPSMAVSGWRLAQASQYFAPLPSPSSVRSQRGPQICDQQVALVVKLTRCDMTYILDYM